MVTNLEESKGNIQLRRFVKCSLSECVPWAVYNKHC